MKRTSLELEETEYQEKDTSPEILLWRWVILRALLDASLQVKDEPSKKNDKNRILRDKAIAFLISTSAETSRWRAYICHSARLDPAYFFQYATDFVASGRRISMRDIPEGFDSGTSLTKDSSSQ